MAWEFYFWELRHEVKEDKMIGKVGEATEPLSFLVLAEWGKEVRDEQALH